MTYTQSLITAALRLYGDNERTRMAIEITLREMAATKGNGR